MTRLQHWERCWSGFCSKSLKLTQWLYNYLSGIAAIDLDFIPVLTFPLLALVKRNFNDRCMIFIQTKLQAHRMHIVLGLLGVNVGEIHGNLSQIQVRHSLCKNKQNYHQVSLISLPRTSFYNYRLYLCEIKHHFFCLPACFASSTCIISFCQLKFCSRADRYIHCSRQNYNPQSSWRRLLCLHLRHIVYRCTSVFKFILRLQADTDVLSSAF